MLAIAPETQLRVYASLRALETRALKFETLVGALKRCCVHGGPGAVPELVAMASELRWQLRQVGDLANELEDRLGMPRGQAPAASARRADEQRDEETGLRGSTNALSVADLFSMLSSLRKTGTLALHANESMFVFEFQQGRIVHAVTNHQDPELRLGKILVAQNKLTETQLSQSLEAISTSHELLGSQLVSSATVSEIDLRAALDEQVRRIFDIAFELRGARFTFVEGSVSNIAQRTTVNTTELLLEAARQADEDVLAGRPSNTKRATQNTLDRVLRG